MQIGHSRPGPMPPQRPATDTPAETTKGKLTGNHGGAGTALSDEQRAVVDKLKARDREVRAHEAAHKAAAGGLARGAASFSYQVGPDNRRYAVGGEVSIDTSAVADDPRASLRKAEAIRAAALAPARPSAQDHAVAARAAQMAASAQRELLQQAPAKGAQRYAEIGAELEDSGTSLAGFDAIA